MEEEGNRRIQQLEQELRYAKESLQTTVEELETSNEELQSSNEELLASNEELQSTNEELHSVNEELYSVNAEHEAKIKELNTLSGDLHNLIRAANVGTVFLDPDWRIRLYTPEAARLFNLLPQDVGRDIRHITSRVRDDAIVAELEAAARAGKDILREVATAEGEVFLRKVSAYRDLDKRPAGMVISFVEVTEQARMEHRLNAQTRFLDSISNRLPALVAYWDRDRLCRYANRRFQDWLGVKEPLGRSLALVHAGQDVERLGEAAAAALRGEPAQFERTLTLADGRVLSCLCNLIPDLAEGQVAGFVEMTTDITRQKEVETALVGQVMAAEDRKSVV
jgi:two-component system CheB/CheR fusion protein